MKQKLVEHILGIIVVTAVLLCALQLLNRGKQQAQEDSVSTIHQYIDCDFIDFHEPFHRALLSDIMNIYHPGQYEKNRKLVEDILRYKEDTFSESLLNAHVKDRLSGERFLQILWMYLKFVLVYGIVMVLTYYGVQTLGVWRFVRKKQRSSAFQKHSPGNLFHTLLFPVRKVIKGIIYFILFCPAYVTAYSIRTEFNTDTVFFMVILGVISNGLLIMYTNKFYTFLVSESRKGYVDTALVKNLHASYSHDKRDGISYRAIFRPVKRFGGHVFGHIFKNAHFQYISTLKEQASFLITGLIIIEMALNIHGHLSYEMLRQILYKNFDIVIIIILCIFYTVKLTEIITDFIMHKESLRYENN